MSGDAWKALAVGAIAFTVVSARADAGEASRPAVYTASQAKAGATVYMQNCAMCHGMKLQGQFGPALKGKNFYLMASNQNLTVHTLRGFIAAHMPANQPGSLSAAQYDDVTAYLLQENGFPAGQSKLAPNSPQSQKLYIAAFPRG